MYWGIGAHGRKKKLTTPQSVIITVFGVSRNTISIWKKKDSTMQYWLEHLQDIFNYPKIDSIKFNNNSSQFDIDDIKEVFGKETKVKIRNTGCHAFNQMILQNFLLVKKLNIMPSNFPNSKILKRILMQNFDHLDIDSELQGTTTMTLDELLLINSRKSYIGFLRISAKQINKFIKLWQKGSNPCMEHLYIVNLRSEDSDKDIVMKGIKHDVIPDNQTRMFKNVGFTDTSLVTGGIDIHRMDGTKATIQIKKGLMVFTVQMYVWLDHCVV
ncbi:hypothetical protein CAEBREN_03634 [Caenorhabditis brenneri]|uniref:Sdz-33 F-box domain-containing protein n=1 Tax=Caenorhabditis brenneri TaxID=135651 RepID=G0N0G3_CAEBE|nr:hypothetical protein CAEBREN_03634 [Caenorhabditis brenneri]